MTEDKRIVIIGDSISAGYTPLVQEGMRDEPVTLQRAGGGDSAQVLANLEEWAIRPNPCIVHFNCGLHDLRFLPDSKTYQQEIDVYETNLRSIVQQLQEKTTAALVWATITPVVDDRHNCLARDPFYRFQRDVLRYNARALPVMSSAGIRINDLHARIVAAGIPGCVDDEGVHMTDRGNRILAAAVLAELGAILNDAR